MSAKFCCWIYLILIIMFLTILFDIIQVEKVSPKNIELDVISLAEFAISLMDLIENGGMSLNILAYFTFLQLLLKL